MQLSGACSRSSPLIAFVLLCAIAPKRVAADPPASAVHGHAGIDAAAYGDTDHVYVLTPSITGSVANDDAGWSLQGSYLVDVVSAASVDIVASASRRWVEVRHAGTLDAQYKPAATGVGLTGAVSSEPDYLSWTAGARVTQDLLDQNLTLQLGYAHGDDTAGRSDTPFSVYAHRYGREHVSTGLTLVLDSATLGSLLFDAFFEHGDQSKPYRYVPLFAPGDVPAAGASIDEVAALRVAERPIERLPDTRQRYALSASVAHRFASSTLRADERLYADSWALYASSTDARYLIDLGPRWELGPHARFHAQTGVRFWQRAYVLRPGFDYPALRTGDRELGPLLAFTLGFTARWGIGSADDPNSWRLGWDMNATDTRYLDHLYLRGRWSAVVALSLEAEL